MEYERRAAKDRANRWTVIEGALWRSVFVAIAVSVALQVIYHTSGVAVGLLFGVLFFLGRVLPKMSTRAWSIGAEGEIATARWLDPLAHHGYVVMHDLRISMSRANIDHLVIGPTGVFVIETKNIKGDVRLGGGTVRMGGRRVAVVEEVRREVDQVQSALGPLLEPRGVRVEALVCAHRADLPWFGRTVEEVRFLYPRDVPRLIRKQPIVLTEVEVAALRARAERFLPPRTSTGPRR